MNPNKLPADDIRQTLGMDDAAGRHRIVKRFVFWGVAVGVGICILVFWNTRNGAEPLRYETREIGRGDLTITVGATGNLEPTNQVDVGSELSGIIKTVEVDFNDYVKIDQVLARLDTDKLQADVTRYQAALESERARLLQARATLKETQAELDRLRHAHELSGGKLPSAYTLETAEAAYSRAEADAAAIQAQIKQARAVLEYAETDLSKALIRSPINGIVLSRDVEPGQTVAASLQAPVLFTLAEDLGLMELHVDVDEADVGRVEPGQEATFTVDAYPDRVFPARITQVRFAAKNTDGVVTYETVLAVNNPELLLRPGMTATADITVARVADALLIPNAALRFVPPTTGAAETAEEKGRSSFTSKLFPRPPRRGKKSSDRPAGPDAGGRHQVWVLHDGKPVSRDISAGLTDGLMTEVTAGDIAAGTAVIVGAVRVQ